MKGLILSGGKGIRLRPLTFSQQKQLIPIANKPILFYCIEDLIGAGIHKIGIIVGPNKEQVIETVSSASWDAEFTFINQDHPGGLAHAVKLAESFLGDDPFIMYLGDNLLKGGIKTFVNDFISSEADASILLTEVEHPEQYGVALVDEQKKVIVQLLEKPKNPPSNLSVVGIYGLKSSIFIAINNIHPSWRGELEITDALHWLITKGYNVRYRKVEGWWKDTGRYEDLLDANHLILDGIQSNNTGVVEQSSVTGRVQIGDNTTVLDHSVIRGPVIIGKECVIRNAYIGPYTSIGDKCNITNTEIENSIIMEGSKITSGGKIVDSLLGRNAHIEKYDELPKGYRFVLGDNSSLRL